jgi:hypothetical protein
MTRESGNGQPAWEEDKTDSSAPLGRETWERRPAQKARTTRENVFP